MVQKMWLSKIHSQQGQGFHEDPQHQTFQGDLGVPQVQFSQQVLLLQLLPVKQSNISPYHHLHKSFTSSVPFEKQTSVGKKKKEKENKQIHVNCI